MSKLEEIKDYTGYPYNNNLEEWIVWLIEQAEKVEEYKEIIEMTGENYELEQETNKRYREAIEEAIEYANSPKILTSPAGIEEILSKALEGGNND